MLVKDFGYWEGGEGPVKSPTGKEINSAAFFSTAVFKAGGIPFPPPQTIPSSHTHSHPGCPPPLLTSVTALYPLTAEVLSVTQDKPCECVVGGAPSTLFSDKLGTLLLLHRSLRLRETEIREATSSSSPQSPHSPFSLQSPGATSRRKRAGKDSHRGSLPN